MTDNISEARLVRIETKLDALIEKVDSHEQATKSRSDKLERILHGDGGRPGVLMRVDRLEQDQERRTWRERALFGIILGLLAKAGFDIIGK
jgi:hypothetical protein